MTVIQRYFYAGFIGEDDALELLEPVPKTLAPLTEVCTYLHIGYLGILSNFVSKSKNNAPPPPPKLVTKIMLFLFLAPGGSTSHGQHQTVQVCCSPPDSFLS